MGELSRQSGILLAFFDAHNGAVTAIATVFIAVFTAALMYVTGRQARLTKEGLSLAQREFVSTQRAFVYLDGFEQIVTTERVDGQLHVTGCFLQPRWRNSGTTPTRKMRIRVDFTADHRVKSGNFDFESENRGLISSMFVGPATNVRSDYVPIDVRIVQDSINGIPNGLVFIFGKSEYLDIFDDKNPHFTKWCYLVRFVPSGADSIKADFVQWTQYNCTDEGDGT